jgi:hypothetical protein
MYLIPMQKKTVHQQAICIERQQVVTQARTVQNTGEQCDLLIKIKIC